MEQKVTTFPKLKKFAAVRTNPQVSTNSFHIDHNKGGETIFMATENADNKFFLECSECGEELGEVTDKNISHQCEYHNCPVT